MRYRPVSRAILTEKYKADTNANIFLSYFQLKANHFR